MRMEKWEPWPDQTLVSLEDVPDQPPLEDVPEHMDMKLTCPGRGKNGMKIIFQECVFQPQ